MQVEAAGVNRLDLIQAVGKYPPPPGESDILGVESITLILHVGSTPHNICISVSCVVLECWVE